MTRPLLLAASAVRSMLLRCRRDLARARGKGGWTAYYYPSGQSGPQEPLAQPPDQPSDEAYGRVTNPERFEPLHSAMMEIISSMDETFDVVRVEGYGLDEELERKRGIARPSVQLTPVDSNAAPITVAFSDFPGLFVRFGRWVTEPFPSCGCDACDESAADEIERLTELVDIVTAGGFREAIKCPRGPLARDAWLEHEFRAPGSARSGKSRITHPRALQMSGGARHLKLRWEPWPRRGSDGRNRSVLAHE